MMIKYSLYILMFASLITSTPIIADQNLNNGHDSIPVLKNKNNQPNVNPPNKTEPANSTPIVIPGKKGEPGEIIFLSKQDKSTPSPLILAVESGDFSLVKKALETADTNIHARDDLDRTSLILAAKRGYLEIVDILLAAGADPNAKDQQSQTALTYAAMTGHDKVTQRLISAHADIEVVDNDGKTPLIWAIISRNTQTVSLLVEAGANVNQPDIKGASPLIYSLTQSSPDITRKLIDSGAEVDVVLKKSNMNTLILAAMQGDTYIIQALINKGIDVNSTTTAGVTPLLAAIVTNKKAAAKLLLASGARLNDKDKVGRSAIFYSANAKIDPEIAQMLIEKGADINVMDNNGFTPLSLAAARGNTEAVKVLIKAGLSASGTSTKGEFTPLMSASANKRPVVVEQLLTYKLDIDARGPGGRTALMWAAQYNCLKCVELLLANGASAELVDEKNKNAAGYAKEKSKAKQILQLLDNDKTLESEKELEDKKIMEMIDKQMDQMHKEMNKEMN